MIFIVIEEEPSRRILRSKRSLCEDSVASPSTEKEGKSCDSGRSTPSTLHSGGTSGQGTDSYPFSEDNVPSVSMSYKEISHNLKNWTLLPEHHRSPAPPVMLFGSIHLLRLFGNSI